MQTCDRSTVANPAAYLATATTRLAVNATQSARVRRETYIGPWLPEPIDTSADPHLGAERGEALGFAVLLLLERLSGNERAAYIPREAFEYPYRQIADILQSTEVAVRQLVSRARKHLVAERRAPVTGSGGCGRSLCRVATCSVTGGGASAEWLGSDSAVGADHWLRGRFQLPAHRPIRLCKASKRSNGTTAFPLLANSSNRP